MSSRESEYIGPAEVAGYITIERRHRRDEARKSLALERARHLRPFIEFFRAHPSPIPTAMNLSDWKRSHPDFPCRSLSYLKGKATLLRRLGLLASRDSHPIASDQ